MAHNYFYGVIINGHTVKLGAPEGQIAPATPSPRRPVLSTTRIPHCRTPSKEEEVAIKQAAIEIHSFLSI